MITLYSKDGITQKAQIHKYTYQGTFLGECFLTIDIESEIPINFEIGDYTIFRDERFVLNYIPAKEKQARKLTYGSAFVYSGIKLNSLADELTRVEFLDVVLNDNGIHYTSQPTFSFYAQNVQDLADRIQANINRIYTGTQAWTVVVSPDAITPDRNISVSNIKVWEALSLVNSEFETNFIIRGRTITIGTAGLAVGKVFGYGKGKGLYDIQQKTNEDALIITRLRAYGSTRNLPHRYYNKLIDPSSGLPYIEESAYIPNLMLPAFPYQNQDPKNVFLDSDNISEYGVREGSVYFDGSDGSNEIYPSLEGMTKQQLNDAGITVSLPSGDNGNIDEVLSADNPDDNGEIPDDPTTIPAQFTIYLKDLGFDLSEKDENGQYVYATTDTMQISMKSGMCIGRTFDVVEDGIKKDTSLGYTRFIVECNRYTDESVQMAYPNREWRIEAGDKFVLLGISMPDVYIKTAAQRLLVAAKEYLSQNDETKYTYLPKIDEKFMADNPSLGESIKEGDILNFEDTDLDIDASVIIQSLKIAYSESLIPTYEVTLSNDRIVGTIEKMQNAISSIVNNATGITLEQVKSLIGSIGGSLFLSKRYNDTAQGLIKFVRGLDIGDFASGAFGSGATFRMNEGDSYLEVDKLFVRKWAQFTEILIERLSHIGGSLVISPARMICSNVEEMTNGYRCYFDTGEGEFVQEFVEGDQARCQVFTGTTQKYYWRLVIGVGSNYIDLSKTDMDSGSGIPSIGDHIVQLGNRNNAERQNAQILSSFGIDAPSYKQYEGIDSYSLVDKEKTVISPSGNKFDGRVTIQSGSTGWENLEGLPEEFQDLSTGAVNLLRNSGFTGDYESKILVPNTELEKDTEMFSEHLAYWEGYGTVNNDEDSQSGYSVTLLDQMLSQKISSLISNENYIISFKAKGSQLTISSGGISQRFDLTDNYERYVHKFIAIEGNTFSISGRGTVCEIQLERGKIVSDWSPSPLDNDKSLTQYQAIRYITDSIKNGNTTILGGLILSSMIQLGNYVNGEMKEVTSGMSGIYVDENDVAFWAGGNMQRAIYSAMNPFSTEADKIINFLVTHGGMLIANNAVIRGTVYATDGEFSGAIKIAGGKILLNKDGSGRLADGNVTWDVDGNVDITGKFESNTDGVRIVIDPSARSIIMYNSNGFVIGRWSFYQLGNITYSSLMLRNIDTNNKTTSTTTIDGGRISVYKGDVSSFPEVSIYPEGETFQFFFNMDRLPASRDTAIVSTLYRDGETIKIRTN